MATSNLWHKAATQFPAAEWTDGAAGSSGLVGKRAFDVVLSVTGLALGLPAMLLATAAVRLESRGSLLTRTKCWGRGARPFDLLRLRTADDAGRMTRAGRVLSRWGIDGLPQLVNVLRGQMSIVGPVPVPAGECDESAVRHLRRFEMQPGMTGLWALGVCHEVPVRDYFSPDKSYVSSWSPWLDLAVVARTLGSLAAGLNF